MAKLSQTHAYTGRVTQNQPPYIPDPYLVQAVNLAISLEKPLLVDGEPGCGKTSLAQAVATELGLPLVIWEVRSSSRVQDGLYTFDAVARLHDAQMGSLTFDKLERKHLDPMNYVKLGPLGTAFASDTKTVLLIDEIDRTDEDFQIDLLKVLEHEAFIIEEGVNYAIRAQNRPIVFITINGSKELSGRFARRCIYHYIKFPDEKMLFEIVKAHFPSSQLQLVQATIKRFLVIRHSVINRDPALRDKVGIDSLLNWFHILDHYPLDDALHLAENGSPLPGPIPQQVSTTDSLQELLPALSLPHRLRVFLCHASGDKPSVRDLYRRLLDSGFAPWLDEEDLLPGQDWQQEIARAVRSSDVVIVCLSKKSIRKTGYVQKEIKYALDIADEQPDGTIFLIPVLLEPCDVPERLSRFHWVELFDQKGYERLSHALHVVQNH